WSPTLERRPNRGDGAFLILIEGGGSSSALSLQVSPKRYDEPCAPYQDCSLGDVADFLFRHLEMCRQSSKEGFFLRLFLVVHSRFHVQDARELFRAGDSEHVKDQTSRQIVQCKLFAVCELKYVPLWVS